jgi:tRNA(Ile)-lysidine synthase
VGPHPAVAAVRRAVRASLAGLEPGDLVLVACSGGADSLALADALAFEAPRAAIVAGGITIDHGLQPGSAARAQQVTQLMTSLRLTPALSAAVTVEGAGGPEGAARTARYAALDEAAAATGAVAILLGHTLDDQAETVLLGLARGSGARSLAGMAGRTGRYLRPLLGIRRDQTRAACAAARLEPWDDPHNSDPAFTRARVRWQLMPIVTEVLGPGAAPGLARTAELLRADADALDSLAAAEIAGLGGAAAAEHGWPVADLAALPAAIRHRVLRQAAIAAGAPPGGLSHRHVASLDELVTAWHGQRWADLPGGVRGERRYGRLLLSRTSGPEITPLATMARSEEPGGRE